MGFYSRSYGLVFIKEISFKDSVYPRDGFQEGALSIEFELYEVILNAMLLQLLEMFHEVICYMPRHNSLLSDLVFLIFP